MLHPTRSSPQYFTAARLKFTAAHRMHSSRAGRLPTLSISASDLAPASPMLLPDRLSVVMRLPPARACGRAGRHGSEQHSRQQCSAGRLAFPAAIPMMSLWHLHPLPSRSLSCQPLAAACCRRCRCCCCCLHQRRPPTHRGQHGGALISQRVRVQQQRAQPAVVAQHLAQLGGA